MDYIIDAINDKELDISTETLNSFVDVLLAQTKDFSFENESDETAVGYIRSKKYNATKMNVRYLLALIKRSENGVVPTYKISKETDEEKKKYYD